MLKYYRVTYVSDNEYKDFGVAYAPEEADLFLVPPSGDRVVDWKPIQFDLIEGGFCDYLANDSGVRLCSENLMSIIEQNKSERDDIQWLQAKVKAGKTGCKMYYILHFPINLAVVDENKSLTLGNVVVKPVFNANVVRNYGIFTLPNSEGMIFFVSGKLKEVIEKSDLKGFCFEEV